MAVYLLHARFDFFERKTMDQEKWMIETQEFSELFTEWPENQQPLKEVFKDLVSTALAEPGAGGELISRPGVSYSFRASAAGRPDRTRPLFFLVDVVVSSAEPWFLSACFYVDEVSDPEELGDAIPEGLFNETGYCFDVEEPDNDLVAYIKQRMDEAFQAAVKK
jgi:hypothetical protein